MIIRRRLVFCFVATLSIVLAEGIPAQTSQPQRTWLKLEAIDLALLLPPPPAADSQEVHEELALMEKLQRSRSPEDIARCSAEAKLTMSAFQSVMGPHFTPENLPKLCALIDDAAANSKLFSKAAKSHFNRPRPALADHDLKPSIEPDDDPSYPSGHSTRGILFAAILTQLEPKKEDALLKRGQEIGFDRVVAGLHYPSDIAGGRVLGREVARLLFADPAFRHDLEIVREEYETARKLWQAEDKK